ncbi:zinc finger protein 501-like [Drosophila busckii]|uniref:zinc finger protein 501-like n=1 Tax=Drosophila busckii TaxID=30019 RepID=UPI00083F0FE0|nr:zinc finger protein 501-like [Drosophila busckii]
MNLLRTDNKYTTISCLLVQLIFIYIFAIESKKLCLKMEMACRVCADRSPNHVDIFDSQDDEPSFAEMLKECMDCRIERGDALPKMICRRCVQATESAFQLKRTIEESHKHFMKMLGHSGEADDENVSICESLEANDWKLEEVELDVSCVKQESAVQELDAQFITKIRGVYKYDECIRKESISKLQELFSDDLPENEQHHLCEICGKSFSDVTLLKEHAMYHNDQERPYKCNYCPKAFNQRSNLQAHVRVHTGERPFQCSHCPKGFSHSHHLKDHLLSHTGERPHSCPQCPKAFHKRSNLQSHLRIHSGERPYVCPYCSKTFNHASNLEKHTRIHSGKRPYQCPHCPKSFTRRQHLKDHILVHTGERPYKCLSCSKDFKSNPGLRKHVCNPQQKTNSTP